MRSNRRKSWPVPRRRAWSTRSAGSLAEALRAESLPPALAPAASLAEHYSHPVWLVRRWLAEFGRRGHPRAARLEPTAGARVCALAAGRVRRPGRLAQADPLAGFLRGAGGPLGGGRAPAAVGPGLRAGPGTRCAVRPPGPATGRDAARPGRRARGQDASDGRPAPPPAGLVAFDLPGRAAGAAAGEPGAGGRRRRPSWPRATSSRSPAWRSPVRGCRPATRASCSTRPARTPGSCATGSTSSGACRRATLPAMPASRCALAAAAARWSSRAAGSSIRRAASIRRRTSGWSRPSCEAGAGFRLESAGHRAARGSAGHDGGAAFRLRRAEPPAT